MGWLAFEIIKWDDGALRRPCRPVRHVSDRVREWLGGMAEAMRAAKGVGLAAPQVGLGWRLVVVDVGDGLLNLVNPRIVRGEGEGVGWEGCLSLPGVIAEVKRAERVTVEAVDERGQRQWLDADGLLARALQHEIDHLDGVLVTDRAARVLSEEEYHALMAAAEAAAEASPRLRVVFMGTPEVAVPSLEALHGAGHAVAAVVTQPDRPRGRSREPSPPPVKAWAAARGFEVAQPAGVRDAGFLAWLGEKGPDVVVTCAFGRILPPAVLAVPRLGCVNVHFSLLPRWRGAAPVQWALMGGDRVTGVTIMYMDAGLDTGDIIMQESVAIDPQDDAAALADRLARVGAALLVAALDLIAQGRAPRQPQDHAAATAAPPLGRRDERIDWRWPAERVAGLVRALSPAPGAFTTRGVATLKIWRGQALPADVAAAADAAASPAAPGAVLAAGADGIAVACGAGVYRVEELQPAGGRRMAAADFLRGRPLVPGERLGDGGRPAGEGGR